MTLALALGTGPAQVDREDLQRVVTVFANAAPGYNLAGVSNGIARLTNAMTLPTGYTIGFGGDTDEMQETSGFIAESVWLAVILWPAP